MGGREKEEKEGQGEGWKGGCLSGMRDGREEQRGWRKRTRMKNWQ